MVPHLKLAILLIATAAIGFGLDLRLGKSGGWLPAIPETVGAWTSVPFDEDATIPKGTRYTSRLYSNPFGETVKAFIASADSVDIFNDPKGCMRGVAFEVTGERPLKFANGDTGRLLVLRKDDQLYLMAYWLQFRDGSVSDDGPLYQDLIGRVTAIGPAALNLLRARPTCICRAFAMVMPDDPNGVMARANVVQIATVVHEALVQGSDNPSRRPAPQR